MNFDQAHHAIKRSDLASLELALRSTLSADAANHFGWTLLMLAAIEGSTSIGSFLISVGAAVNSQNDFGDTALSLAACGGHLRFVHLLKQSGATGASLRPHGHDLPTWIRSASGLPEEKIAEMLAAIGSDIGGEFAAGERGR